MARCKECGAEIYFLTTKKGKKIPVDADSMTEEDVQDIKTGNKRLFRYGDHVAHFLTCTDPDKFRKTE